MISAIARGALSPAHRSCQYGGLKEPPRVSGCHSARPSTIWIGRLSPASLPLSFPFPSLFSLFSSPFCSLRHSRVSYFSFLYTPFFFFFLYPPSSPLFILITSFSLLPSPSFLCLSTFSSSLFLFLFPSPLQGQIGRKRWNM